MATPRSTFCLGDGCARVFAHQLLTQCVHPWTHTSLCTGTSRSAQQGPRLRCPAEHGRCRCCSTKPAGGSRRSSRGRSWLQRGQDVTEGRGGVMPCAPQGECCMEGGEGHVWFRRGVWWPWAYSRRGGEGWGCQTCLHAPWVPAPCHSEGQSMGCPAWVLGRANPQPQPQPWPPRPAHGARLPEPYGHPAAALAGQCPTAARGRAGDKAPPSAPRVSAGRADNRVLMSLSLLLPLWKRSFPLLQETKLR